MFARLKQKDTRGILYPEAVSELYNFSQASDIRKKFWHKQGQKLNPTPALELSKKM